MSISKIILTIGLMVLGPLISIHAQSGDALDFDGDDDYVSISNPSNNVGDEGTLSVWAKTDTTDGPDADRIIFGHFAGGSNDDRLYIGLDMPSGEWQVGLAADFFNPGNTKMDTGKWHFATLVWDNGDYDFYVNGVHKGGGTYSGSVNTNQSDWEIGRLPDAKDRYWYGAIDEVRLWDVAKSQSKIRNNMCLALSGSESNLVGYWDFNDGSGTTLSDKAGSNDGTLGGGNSTQEPSWVSSGAIIGDESNYRYTNSWSGKIIAKSSNDGDQMKVSQVQNNPDGVQLVLVNSAPNNIIANAPLEQISQERYWIVHVIGGSGPTYDLTYQYGAHPGWSAESDLDIASRADNTVTAWDATSAMQDNSADKLELTGQSGTEYTLGTTNTSDPLPVELTHFIAKKSGESVELTWGTASETHNSHFLVQRSNQDRWETIGRVKGHGTTTQPQEYRFLDDQPQNGTNYYRLKQVDFGGTFEYSSVKAVRIDEGEQASLVILQNPVEEDLNVRLNTKADGQYRYNLYNSNGHPVNQGTWSLSKGQHVLSINMADQRSGIYYLELYNDHTRLETRKILK